MKKARVLILTLLLSGSLFASTFDLSLFFGPGTDSFSATGVSINYGVNLGVTKKMEVSLWGLSELTPAFFGKNKAAIELDFDILGDRNTGTKVAGVGINSAVGLGVIASLNNPYNYFMPTDVFVSITPLTVGSPMLERRDRVSKIMVSYNWFENKVSVLYSLVLFDYYLKGTWREYR